MNFSRNLRNDTECAASTASQSKVDVLVFASVCSHKGSIRKDYLHLHVIVNTQTVSRRERPMASSLDPSACSANSWACAAHNLYEHYR